MMGDGCPGGSCGISCDDGSCGTSCSDGDCGTRLPPGMLTKYNLNQDISDGILVFLDNYHGSDMRNVAKLVSVARKNTSGRVFGAIFGGSDLKETYPSLISMGIDTLYHIRNADLLSYSPEGCSGAIIDLCERIAPSSIFFNSSGVGPELASIIAGSMGAGIVTGATDVSFKGRDATAVTSGKKVAFRGYPQIVVFDDRFLPAAKTGGNPKGTTINRPYSPRSKPQSLDAKSVDNCVFVGKDCPPGFYDLARRFAQRMGVTMHEDGTMYGRCLLLCPSKNELDSVQASAKLCIFDSEPDFDVGCEYRVTDPMEIVSDGF